MRALFVQFLVQVVFMRFCFPCRSDILISYTQSNESQSTVETGLKGWLTQYSSNVDFIPYDLDKVFGSVGDAYENALFVHPHWLDCREIQSHVGAFL